MTAKNKGGRPPRSPEEKQGSLVSVRFTAAERAGLEAAAEAAGVSVAEWVRVAAVAKMKRGGIRHGA